MKYTFTRVFTGGAVMKGIVRQDTMDFVDAKAAKEWMDGVNANNKKGKCDYYVKDMKPAY